MRARYPRGAAHRAALHQNPVVRARRLAGVGMAAKSQEIDHLSKEFGRGLVAVAAVADQVAVAQGLALVREARDEVVVRVGDSHGDRLVIDKNVRVALAPTRNKGRRMSLRVSLRVGRRGRKESNAQSGCAVLFSFFYECAHMSGSHTSR
ncbi:hypothetical protein T492DRAFT_1075386 [Pavlovales sp. CCMP2436]|nr:hypothetical protein T492DRAFT_1075386 [Pavlovales sp. CCMP2436]